MQTAMAEPGKMYHRRRGTGVLRGITGNETPEGSAT